MTKEEFYKCMISMLERRAQNGIIEDSAEHRGNLAYLCDFFPEDKYKDLFNSLENSNDNDYCWILYNLIHNDVLPKLNQHEMIFDAARQNTRELDYEMELLNTFSAVLPKRFPKWFFFFEKL